MEDERGTYIFNSKDLCLLPYLPDLYDAGLCSLKIEGRMKSVHYVATVVKVYRQAIDAYERDPENFSPPLYAGLFRVPPDGSRSGVQPFEQYADS